MLTPPNRYIRLARDPLEGHFLVEIVPPPEEGASFDATYPSYRSARGYAGGLRMCAGWELVDLCETSDG